MKCEQIRFWEVSKNSQNWFWANLFNWNFGQMWSEFKQNWFWGNVSKSRFWGNVSKNWFSTNVGKSRIGNRDSTKSIAMLSRDFFRFIVFEAFKMLIIGILAPFLTLTTSLKPSLTLTLTLTVTTNTNRRSKTSIYVIIMAIDHVTNHVTNTVFRLYLFISTCKIYFDYAYDRIKLVKMYRLK